MANKYSLLSLLLVCLATLCRAVWQPSVTWTAYAGEVNKSRIDLIPSSTSQGIAGFYNEVATHVVQAAANGSHSRQDSCPFFTMIAGNNGGDPAKLKITWYINATETDGACFTYMSPMNTPLALKACVDSLNSHSATTGCCVLENPTTAGLIPGGVTHVKLTMHPIIFPIETIKCYGEAVGGDKVG